MSVTNPPDILLEPSPDGEEPITPVINSEALSQLGQKLKKLHERYAGERRLAEEKWLRNLRQYRGQYDPEVLRHIPEGMSRAYPRLTRVKCVTVLSRVMNLMFPGNEKNWELKASPNAEMSPADINEAIQKAVEKAQEIGLENVEINEQMVEGAVQDLANQRAKMAETLIEDQMEEIGGDQTKDYIRLNREVLKSGILYGVGLMRGPFVRETQNVVWRIDPQTGQPAPMPRTGYKPQFELVPVWDFYPDMSANTIADGDGYFIRIVMSKAQLRKLADRDDFYGETIKDYIAQGDAGNYKQQTFEAELRAMDTSKHVASEQADKGKFEIMVWHGSISAKQLTECGVDVPEEMRADDVNSEIWLLDGHVIKADMNPWQKLGIEVDTIHAFIFDEDDTSPLGFGVPDIIRDSQMTICAATRMLLDNASLVCGIQMEVNVDLLEDDQDTGTMSAHKLWRREGMGEMANYPALRAVQTNSHMDELLTVIQRFLDFADLESFVGPASGGDVTQAPSEPMRTAAGASMMRSDAALPFKDIVRNFDCFTQSVIYALVAFNRKFNPNLVMEGDYDVVARGATSLVAKEVRGMQVDQLMQTMTEQEFDHVDERRMVETRFAVRDLNDMLVTPDEVKRRRDLKRQQEEEEKQMQVEQMQAQIRETLAKAFKAIADGKARSSGADVEAAKAAMELLQEPDEGEADGQQGQRAGAGASRVLASTARRD